MIRSQAIDSLVAKLEAAGLREMVGVLPGSSL